MFGNLKKTYIYKKHFYIMCYKKKVDAYSGVKLKQILNNNRI